MTTRDVFRPAAALAFLALATAAWATLRPVPPLEARYRLTLTSAWPQLSGPDASCGNGGDEVVEGVLTRSGPDRYQGSFRRRTTLRFCGAHGASGAPCALVLRGEGSVVMTGLVVRDDRSPSGKAFRLTWTPEPGHGARTEGACAAGFKQKVEEMYLSVRHGVEFALPEAGAAPYRERLDGYGWTVTID